jgi:RTX calcium-binding nonapeptide repeat (4 copies)/Domain of unknown function DUF11
MSRRLWSLLVLCGFSGFLALPGHAEAALCGFSGEPACKADLSVALTPPAGTVYVGELVTIAVTGSNAGPDSRIPVTMSVSVPGTVSPLGSTHTDGECVASCTVPFLPLSTQAPLQSVVHVRPEVAGPVTVTATISGQGRLGVPATDPNPANNTATLTLNAVVGRCTSQIALPDRSIVPADILGSIGGDVINAEDWPDSLDGGAGDDCIAGGAGDDTIRGGPGNDVLHGGFGNDFIIGGPGRDKIQGNDGADLIDTVDGEPDVVNCGFGIDRLRADQFDHFRRCDHVTIEHRARK